MFNPLALFTTRTLESFVVAGKKYFVRQTFNRARKPFEQEASGLYLLCHYEIYAQAKEHYDAIADDPARFLYEWENKDHQKRLALAATQPKGYQVYCNTFLPDWERHVTNRLKAKIRSFIQFHGWKPGREDGVLIDFYPHFGEVMVTLRFREQKLSVKLEEIEKKF